MLFIIYTLLIMRKYELVCVIESTLASTDANALIERIENILAWQSVTISETDDMGLVPVAYPLNGQDQARIVSYCVAADPAVLGEVKSQLRLEKGLWRRTIWRSTRLILFLIL